MTVSSPRSRRAILAGALGGIGAWAAASVGSRTKVAAANDDPILIGQSNLGTATTTLENTENTNGVLYLISSPGGNCLYAYTPDGYGLYGQTDTGAAVRAEALEGGIGLNASSQSGLAIQAGTNSGGRAISGQAMHDGGTGVFGQGGTSVGPAARGKTGVHGFSGEDAQSRGVIGESPAGQGVRGETASGVGVFGMATSGFALRTDGRIKADKVSGVASIPAGSTSVTVTPGVNIVGGSFVLLTPMANLGSRALWFTKNETANTITIRISSSRTSATKVAWLLLG